MNRQLSAAELAALPAAVPILTKRDKLLRLAKIVRECPYRPVMLNGIEYAHRSQLAQLQDERSAFALAARDPILHDAGMTTHNVQDAMTFFELSLDELHAFACGCGGQLDNDQMARRIEALASYVR